MALVRPPARFWNEKLAEPWRAVPLVRDATGIEWEQGASGRNPQKIRLRVEAAIDHWIHTARQMPVWPRGVAPLPRPRVLYDLKGSSIAGMAMTHRQRGRVIDQWIRIHPELIQRYPVRMIQQTVPHEIAHLVVDWYLPHAKVPHGPEWMAVMVFFGRPPQTHHDMEGVARARRASRDEHSQLLFEAPHGERVGRL